MKQVLIVDTETTSLDPATGRCIEVAAVLYSLEHRCVVEAYSRLIDAGTNEAEDINHIPSGALRLGVAEAEAWEPAELLSVGCSAILAHNADFDRQWAPKRLLGELPWIDTMSGIRWPNQTREFENLISLCLAHGLGVVDPHRALSDCMLLARLLTRCAEMGHDLDALLARGLRPSAMFQALVSFDDRELAKQAGFHWDAPTKRWLRRLAIEDAGLLSFKTKRVDK